MNDVRNIESFFNHEFTTEELMAAIEKMNYYSDEVVKLYGLENEENPEKTYVLGSLASAELSRIYTEEYHNDVYFNSNSDFLELTKLGMNIAKDKYSSYTSLKTDLEKAFKIEDSKLEQPLHSRSYTKNMKNLERVMKQWNDNVIETKNGGRVDASLYGVWIDNWRLVSENANDNSEINWTLRYKGNNLVKAQDNKALFTEESVQTYLKLSEEERKNFLGNVLQIINDYTQLETPQKDTLKPSNNFYIDKMNFKENSFIQNPPYEDFVDNLNKANSNIQDILKTYEDIHILPVSRHPEDKNLFVVSGKSLSTNDYTVWTSYNAESNSLNNGHYNLPQNEAAKIMCQFSSSEPLHTEHHQQYINKNTEVER